MLDHHLAGQPLDVVEDEELAGVVEVELAMRARRLDRSIQAVQGGIPAFFKCQLK